MFQKIKRKKKGRVFYKKKLDRELKLAQKEVEEDETSLTNTLMLIGVGWHQRRLTKRLGIKDVGKDEEEENDKYF